MPPPQNNDASEDFGTLPQDSEGFGNIPNHSERKENHVLTVHSVARMFEEAGVARTERSVTNWCQLDRNGVSRLDCYYDPNERKYYITPQSDQNFSQESFRMFRNRSEMFRRLRKVSTPFRTPPNRNHQSNRRTNQTKKQICCLTSCTSLRN